MALDAKVPVTLKGVRYAIIFSLFMVISFVHLPGMVQRLALTVLLFLTVTKFILRSKILLAATSFFSMQLLVYLYLLVYVNEFNETVMNTSIVLLVNQIWLLVLYCFFSDSKFISLKGPIKLVLITHLVAFYSQFLLFYGFGFDFRPFEFISFEEQRSASYGFLEMVLPIRSSGFYVEPSTYSSAISILYMIYWLNDGRSPSVFFGSVVSCLLSFSGLGIVLGTLMLIVFRPKVAFFCLILLLGVFIYTPVPDFDNEYILTATMRIELIRYIFDRDFFSFVFGTSIFAIDPELLSMASSTDNNRIASINDLGWIVTLVLYSGIVGLVLWLLIFFRSKSKALMLVGSLSKFSHMHAILFYMLTLNVRRKN